MKILKSPKTILIALLTLMALINSAKWLAEFTQSPYQALDFRTYYLATETYFSGHNPYIKSEQQLIWENSSNKQAYGTPHFDKHETVVYAPQFVWFFKIYQSMDYETAKWLHFLFNILALFGSIILINKLNPSISKIHITIGILAFKGTWYAFNNGQPMLQILFLILLSLYILIIKKRDIIPGVLLGICAFKFTFIVPIVLYLLVQKQNKTVIALILCSIILNALTLAYHLNAADIVHDWLYNLDNMSNAVLSTESSNTLSIINTSIAYTLKLLFKLSNLSIKLTLLICLALGTILIFLKTLKTETYFKALFLYSLLNLCFGQHLIYDILITIAYLMLDNKYTLDIKWQLPIILALTLPLSIFRTYLPTIDLIVPILIFVFTMKEIFAYLFNKNKAIKNPS